MPNHQTAIATALMALTIYTIRMTAYLILHNKVLTPRVMVVLKSSPGCVMLAFTAPFFTSGALVDLIALSITLFIVMRSSMPITVISGVLAASILRHCFGRNF